MNKQQPSINSTFIPTALALANQQQPNATSWLNDYRQAQTALMAKNSFPHTRVEHFKYNRLHDFNNDDFNQLADTDTADLANYEIAGLNTTDTYKTERIVFVNGELNLTLSNFATHQITNLNAANSNQQAKILAMLNTQDTAKNLFTQYNAMLTGVNNNAVLIQVDESSDCNLANDLIEIIYLNTSSSANKSVNSQVFIDIAKGCKATVIERTLSSEAVPTALSTNRTIINIADNANCTHYNLALHNANSLHFASICYNLGSHSSLTAFHTATGSKLKKIDVEANHLGQHAHASINGLYVATDSEQIDYHTTVTHPLPNGTTDENFRGIVNGNAEATFNGRIHIFADAQKTLAELSNKNLLLSDDAILHTKPELEIYADDVVCAHGATVSRLDNRSLNYLRARGIAKAEAEVMLSYAFFDELLAELKIEAIAEYLRPILFAKFQ